MTSEASCPVKEFSALSSALLELGKAVINMKNVPENERKRYRDVIVETFGMIDSAILMVINKLGSLVQLANEYEYGDEERHNEIRSQFAFHLSNLALLPEWEDAERKVSLCRPLRNLQGEIRSIRSKLRAYVSFNKPEDLRTDIDDILDGERGLAMFISSSLRDLASRSTDAFASEDGFKNTAIKISETREALKQLRKKLIQSELHFDNNLSAPSGRGKNPGDVTNS